MSDWIQRYVDPRDVVTHPVRWTKAFAYAKLMESGAIFPPVKAAIDPMGRIIVRNGAHRTYAARLSGKPLLIKHKAERMRVVPRGQYAANSAATHSTPAWVPPATVFWTEPTGERRSQGCVSIEAANLLVRRARDTARTEVEVVPAVQP